MSIVFSNSKIKTVKILKSQPNIIHNFVIFQNSGGVFGWNRTYNSQKLVDKESNVILDLILDIGKELRLGTDNLLNHPLPLKHLNIELPINNISI